MWQFGVRIKSGFVHPLGVNVKNQGIAERFIEMNADAAWLGARGLEERLQFFAELLLFSGDWFETDKSVQRQGAPPAEYSLRTVLQGRRSSGAQRTPLLGWQESKQAIPFFFRKNRVVQGSVGQTRLSGAEHGDDSQAPYGTPESKTDQSVTGFVLLADGQEILPMAFP